MSHKREVLVVAEAVALHACAGSGGQIESSRTSHLCPGYAWGVVDVLVLLATFVPILLVIGGAIASARARTRGPVLGLGACALVWAVAYLLIAKTILGF